MRTVLRRTAGWLAAALVLAGVAQAAEPPAIAAPDDPPRPAVAAVSRAAAEGPSGAAALVPDGESLVDPAASFELELAVRAPDARLVLLDGADAHVASTGSREVGPTTRLTLVPAAPLVPGARYVLRVEGAGAKELRDDAGRTHAPVSFRLLVAGTPPPPEPKAKPPKGKPKRRPRR